MSLRRTYEIDEATNTQVLLAGIIVAGIDVWVIKLAGAA